MTYRDKRDGKQESLRAKQIISNTFYFVIILPSALLIKKRVKTLGERYLLD